MREALEASGRLRRTLGELTLVLRLPWLMLLRLWSLDSWQLAEHWVYWLLAWNGCRGIRCLRWWRTTWWQWDEQDSNKLAEEGGKQDVWRVWAWHTESLCGLSLMMWLRLNASLILLIPSLINKLDSLNELNLPCTTLTILAATFLKTEWHTHTHTHTHATICMNEHLWVAEIDASASWWLISFPSVWVDPWSPRTEFAVESCESDSWLPRRGVGANAVLTDLEAFLNQRVRASLFSWREPMWNIQDWPFVDSLPWGWRLTCWSTWGKIPLEARYPGAGADRSSSICLIALSCFTPTE